MKILKPGQRVTVQFSVENPFNDEEGIIECSADVKINEKLGRLVYSRLFYIDPKYPDNPHFSYCWSESPSKEKLRLGPSKPSIAIEKVERDINDPREMTDEEYRDAVINLAVDNYFFINAVKLIEKYGFTVGCLE